KDTILVGVVVIAGLGGLTGLGWAIYGTSTAINWWAALAWIGGPLLIVFIISSIAYAVGNKGTLVTFEAPKEVKAKPQKPKGTPFYKLMFAYLMGKKKKFCPAIKVI